MGILEIIILMGTVIFKSISTLQKCYYGHERQRHIEELSQTGGVVMVT